VLKIFPEKMSTSEVLNAGAGDDVGNSRKGVTDEAANGSHHAGAGAGKGISGEVPLDFFLGSW